MVALVNGKKEKERVKGWGMNIKGWLVGLSSASNCSQTITKKRENTNFFYFSILSFLSRHTFSLPHTHHPINLINSTLPNPSFISLQIQSILLIF